MTLSSNIAVRTPSKPVAASCVFQNHSVEDHALYCKSISTTLLLLHQHTIGVLTTEDPISAYDKFNISNASTVFDLLGQVVNLGEPVPPLNQRPVAFGLLISFLVSSSRLDRRLQQNLTIR